MVLVERCWWFVVGRVACRDAEVQRLVFAVE